MARPANPNIDALTRKAALEVGIDPVLFKRLITRGERSWKGWQASPAGAFGPSQLMPGTAQGLADKYGIDPQDYYGNLLGGAYYLRDQLKAFGGNKRKAVAAYNAGPGNVQKYGGIPPFAETQRYVKNIFGGWNPNQTNPSAAVPAPRATPRGGFIPPAAKAAPLAPPSFNALGALTALSRGGSAMDALSQMFAAPAKKAKTTKTVAVVETPPGQKNIPVQATKGTKPGAEVEGIVALAKEYLGTPYSWGGGDTTGATYGVQQGANTKGFDCSGFLQYLWYKTTGKDIGGYTGTQWTNGTAVDRKNLRPGDAVFFHMGSDGVPGHVGMYVGNGKFIQAPHTGDVIKISNLDGYGGYVGARRYG